ncbi:MAG TPA: cyanophycinase [Flavobacterium sp.]|nr:cyanophycinase [Flavobacterium sp.]
MKIKGKLIIIGGKEDKGNEELNSEFVKIGILERIVQESRKKKKSRIEIVTSASTIPFELGKDYIKAFNSLGAENTGFFVIENREEASNPEILKRLEDADVVFFTGGDQLRLTSILGGTPFFDILKEKLEEEENFIYAGTSAGAAAASESMIAKGNSADAILKGEIRTSAGFGLIENVFFDTHFIQRGRIGRLLQVIVSNPKVLGIGLEENTALIITPDSKMEAIGTGVAILVDGRSIKNTNLLDIKERAPISIENMVLHVMSDGDIYDLEAHRLEIITKEECRI